MGRARTITNELKLGNLVHILYKLNNYQYADGVEAIGPLLKENTNNMNYHTCHDFFLTDHLWPDLAAEYLYYPSNSGTHGVNYQLLADIYGRPQNTVLIRGGGRAFQNMIIKRIKNGEMETLVSRIQDTLSDAEYVSFESGIRKFLSKVPEAEARENNERFQINATVLTNFIRYICGLFTISNDIEECYANVIAWLTIGCILRDRLSEIQDMFQYECIAIPTTNISEKYIFISYAHKDSNIVLPILRRMSLDGYAIWYDDHIAAASEWDDSIAEHIENSSYVISFISKNYMESENCMDELKYAKDERKKPLLVFLERVSLSSGLRMRLNHLQHIYKADYPNNELFFKKLYEAKGIDVCKQQKITTEDLEVNELDDFYDDIDFVDNFEDDDYLITEGNISKNVKWRFSKETNTLIISGNGEMPDYYRPEPDTPWKAFRNDIEKVEISAGITVVGMQAFYQYPRV